MGHPYAYGTTFCPIQVWAIASYSYIFYFAFFICRFMVSTVRTAAAATGAATGAAAGEWDS